MDERARAKAIEAELSAARRARADGKEGRARVCARRAAGIAIGDYYIRKTGAEPTSNAYILLLWLQECDEIPLVARQAAQRLTVRVTKEFELPHPEDPLEDAELIIQAIKRDAG